MIYANSAGSQGLPRSSPRKQLVGSFEEMQFTISTLILIVYQQNRLKALLLSTFFLSFESYTSHFANLSNFTLHLSLQLYNSYELTQLYLLLSPLRLSPPLFLIFTLCALYIFNLHLPLCANLFFAFCIYLKFPSSLHFIRLLPALVSDTLPLLLLLVFQKQLKPYHWYNTGTRTSAQHLRKKTFFTKLIYSHCCMRHSSSSMHFSTSH